MGTLTSTVRLSKPTIGGDTAPTWPNEINSDMDYVDQAINQLVSIPIADTNISLVADGSSGDQARYLIYNFTGALTADRTVTLPSNVKIGWALNATTGGHNVILKYGAGAGTTLSLASNGAWVFFFADGTNVIQPAAVINAATLAVSGASTLTGVTTIHGATTIDAAGGLSVSSNIFCSGNSTTQGYMQVNGSNTAAGQNGWFYAPNGNGPASGSQLYGISSVAPVLSSGFFANSDARVKSDIRPISHDEGVAFVELASPVRYKKQRGHEAGFLAQDQVRAGYGEYILTTPNEALQERIDDDGLISYGGVELNLNYNNYIAYLTAALQGALARIEALEKRA